MNAKCSANTMPLVREHKRERAGENILFNARTRSKLAKQGGDALSDLAQRDVDRTGRYPAPAEIGTGGELVPGEPTAVVECMAERAPALALLRD